MEMHQSLSFDPSLALGDERIDASHKYIFFLLNKALVAVDQKIVQEEIDQLLCACIEYATSHFIDEEALMRATAYPNIEEHIKDHTRFYEEVSRINHYTIARHSNIVSWAISYCTEHINKHDRMFANYCQGRSIKSDGSGKRSQYPRSGIAAF